LLGGRRESLHVAAPQYLYKNEKSEVFISEKGDSEDAHTHAAGSTWGKLEGRKGDDPFLNEAEGGAREITLNAVQSQKTKRLYHEKHLRGRAAGNFERGQSLLQGGGQLSIRPTKCWIFPSTEKEQVGERKIAIPINKDTSLDVPEASPNPTRGGGAPITGAIMHYQWPLGTRIFGYLSLHAQSRLSQYVGGGDKLRK